jgi:TPR repeat protein
MKLLLFIIPFLFITSISLAKEEFTSQQALEAERSGDHPKAIEIFTKLAQQGDHVSMVNVGAKYYNGEGVKQDYKKSMDWWLKAFKLGNGDAVGNIGVLYRDGKGVKQNRKIAYLLFLITHMEGLGTEATQYRVNSHLRREMTEQPEEDIKDALCYTGKYLLDYLEARGNLDKIAQDTLPSSGRIRFKDNNWWLSSEKEKLNYPCRPPWD